MSFRLVFFVLVLWVIASPATADGWFDDLRIEIKIEHGDAAEIQGLLSTLVPDVSYELVGKTLVARGRSEALAQVQEMAFELDRPLNQVVLDVKAFELSQRTYEHLSRGPDPSYLKRKTRYEPTQDSSVGIWLYPYAHSGPRLHYPAYSGDAKHLFERRLELQLGASTSLELPDEVARQLFKVESLRLKVAMVSFSEKKFTARFSFESGRSRWYAQVRSPDGETLVIGNPVTRRVIFLTPHLMR